MQQTELFDARRLRALLAAERITRTRFAQVCRLDSSYMQQLLAGYRQPGELALIKIERGLCALGLSLDTDGGPHAA